MIGKKPKREGIDDEPAMKAASRMVIENGEQVVWTGARMDGGESMADLLASWPMPEDEHADYDGMHVYGNDSPDGSFEESSEDSAAKQLQAEMVDSQMNDAAHANGHVSSSSEDEDSGSEGEGSDVDMCDTP